MFLETDDVGFQVPDFLADFDVLVLKWIVPVGWQNVGLEVPEVAVDNADGIFGFGFVGCTVAKLIGVVSGVAI